MTRLNESKLFVYSLLSEWILLFFSTLLLRYPTLYLNRRHGKLRISFAKAYYDYNLVQKASAGDQKAYTEF